MVITERIKMKNVSEVSCFFKNLFDILLRKLNKIFCGELFISQNHYH